MSRLVPLSYESSEYAVMCHQVGLALQVAHGGVLA